MEQFIAIKADHPDALLFYRMGDFYELFFDDAVEAAQALGITLTKRGKHLGEDIPMCGVPVHAADDYLQRLIAKGYRVAVCEQTEDPAEATQARLQIRGAARRDPAGHAGHADRGQAARRRRSRTISDAVSLARGQGQWWRVRRWPGSTSRPAPSRLDETTIRAAWSPISCASTRRR